MDIYYKHNNESKKATLNVSAEKPLDFVFLGPIPDNNILGSAILVGRYDASLGKVKYQLEGISSSGGMDSLNRQDIIGFCLDNKPNLDPNSLGIYPNWQSIKVVPNPEERGPLELPDAYEYLGDVSITSCSYIEGKELIKEEAEVQDFDYAVIKYKWTSSGGSDLDTRTYISNPNRSSIAVLGWSKATNDLDYLTWNNDNTGSGVEGVLVNIPNLKRDFPGQKEFRISLAAFWYNTVNSGDLTVEVNTYKGGVMSRSGYDWSNSGGTLVQNLNFNTNIKLQTQNSSTMGVPLGYLSYDTDTNLGKLSNEVTEDGGVIPSLPEVPTHSHTFKIIRDITDTSPEDPISVYFSTPDSDNKTSNWRLIDDEDFEWASYTEENLTVAENFEGYIDDARLSHNHLYFKPNLGSSKTYTLYTEFETLLLSQNFDGPVSLNLPVPKRSFEMIEFSGALEEITFNFPYTVLKVPSYLPDSVKTFSNMFTYCHFFNDPNISLWNTSNIKNMEAMFMEASSFNQPLNNWNTNSVLYMNDMFSSALSFNQNINNWDVYNVVNISSMFQNAVTFNQPLNSWNVSSLEDMTAVFQLAKSFNKPLNNWEIPRNITSLYAMFSEAKAFNQDISSWNISNIDNVNSMFSGASSFNQDLSEWCAAKLISPYNDYKNFSYNTPNWTLPKPIWGSCPVNDKFIFSIQSKAVEGGNSPFSMLINSQGSSWQLLDSDDNIITEYTGNEDPQSDYEFIELDTSYMGTKVTITSDLYNKTKTYTLIGSINELVIGDNRSSNLQTPYIDYRKIIVKSFSTNVRRLRFELFNIDLEVPNKLPKTLTETKSMFEYCNLFNQNINSWDVSNINNMSRMFARCSDFNQPLDSWDVSNVESFEGMFLACKNFNQNINNWDISSADEIEEMFLGCEKFNQPLNDWDISNLRDLSSLFRGCYLFDQDLSLWDVEKINRTSFMFTGCRNFNQDISMWLFSNITVMDYMFDGATNFNQDLSSWNVLEVSTKPTNFDNNASNWTLPKPLWGTTGLKIVEPLSWTMTNIRDPNKELSATIVIKENPDKAIWSLHRNDVLVADSSGFVKDATVNKHYYGSYHIYIELYGSGISTNTYKLFTEEVLTVELGHSSFYDVEKDGDIVINSFGAGVLEQSFSYQNCSLVVPENLPKYVRSLKNMFATQSKFNQDISLWDVSLINNMDNMFLNCPNFNQDLSNWNVKRIKTKPIKFDEGAVSWDLSKPLWGTAGVDPEYLPIDITGQSGVYLTLSKNAGPFETYNLTDPSFNPEQFLQYLASGRSQDRVAFFSYPSIMNDGQAHTELGSGFSGLNSLGNVVSPLHPETGFKIVDGFYGNGVTYLPPYKIVKEFNKITLKQTESVPPEYDIFLSLPGATVGSLVTITSNAAILL